MKTFNWKGRHYDKVVAIIRNNVRLSTNNFYIYTVYIWYILSGVTVAPFLCPVSRKDADRSRTQCTTGSAPLSV